LCFGEKALFHTFLSGVSSKVKLWTEGEGKGAPDMRLGVALLLAVELTGESSLGLLHELSPVPALK
jgi:hypothetical protein